MLQSMFQHSFVFCSVLIKFGLICATLFALSNKLVVIPHLAPFTLLYAILTSHSQIHFPNATFGVYR